MPRDNRSTHNAYKARVLEGAESGTEDAWTSKMNSTASGIYTFPAGRGGVGTCIRVSGSSTFTPTVDTAAFPTSFRWVSFGVAIRSSGATDSDLLIIKDEAALAAHLVVRMLTTGSEVYFQLRNGHDGAIRIETERVTASEWVYLEAQVYVGEADGEGILRLDQATAGTTKNVNLAGQFSIPAVPTVEDISHTIAVGGGGWVELDDLYVIQGETREDAPLLGDIRVSEMLADGVGLGGQTWSVVTSPTHHEAIDEASADSDATYLFTNTDQAVDAFTKSGPDAASVPGPVELVGASIDARLDEADDDVKIRGLIGDLTDFRTVTCSERAVPNLVYDSRSGARNVGLQDRRMERQALARMEVGLQPEIP